MACPYLQGIDLYSCAATRDVYIPSRFELREYCTSVKYDFYRICTSYRKAACGTVGDASARRTALQARKPDGAGGQSAPEKLS